MNQDANSSAHPPGATTGASSAPRPPGGGELGERMPAQDWAPSPFGPIERAELAERESEQRFRQLADAMPQLVWTANPDGTVDYYNERRSEFEGFVQDAEGRWVWTPVLHPDDVAPTTEAWNHAVTSGEIYQIEHRVRRADGSYRWYLSRGVPARDDDGRLVRWYGTATDIDDAKRAEEELAHAQRILNEGQRIAHLGSWEYVAATRSTIWSDELKRIHGLDPADPSPPYEEMLRLHIHPEDAAELDQAFRAALRAGADFENENRIVRPDGSVRFIYNKAQPYCDGEGRVVRYVGATLDITERKQAEEVLSHNAALFSRIIEQAPGGVYVVDAQFRLAQVNAQALPIFASVQPLIGRDFDEVMEIIWGPEVGPRCAAAFRQTLETGERYVSPRFSEQRHDVGVEQAFEWETQRISLPDGQYGVVCYFQDVTERYRRERNLAFLAELQKEIVPLSSAEEIMRTAGARLAALLRLTHCLFVEVDDPAETCTVVHDHHAPGEPNLKGSYRIAEFHNEEERRIFATGGVVAVADVRHGEEPATRAERFEALGIRGFVNVAYVTDGRWKFVMHGSRAEPGEWAPEDVTLIREVAERTCLRIERARAEEALRESEERFRTMADAMPQLAWIGQPDGAVNWYNQRWYQYTGTGPEQMAGSGWQSVHDPEELPAVLEQWQASIATGQPFAMTLRLRGADGVFRPFLTRGLPLRDAAGRVSRWFGTNTDVDELKRAEDALKAALADQEALLKEVHHRVKNNMQILSSLVSLQAQSLLEESRSPDLEASSATGAPAPISNHRLQSAFEDLRDRIRSMALVHEKLYASENFAFMSFATYARNLLESLWHAHRPEAAIALHLHLEPVTVPLNQAVPCGLLLNELAINTLKHAFKGRSAGAVTVSTRTLEDGRVSLCVADDGVGLPEGLNWPKASTLGLRLVQMLSRQLDGIVEARRPDGGGTEFEVVFPVYGDKQEYSAPG